MTFLHAGGIAQQRRVGVSDAADDLFVVGGNIAVKLDLFGVLMQRFLCCGDEADRLDGYQFLEHETPSFLIEADRRSEVAQKSHGAPTGDGAGGRADVHHGLHALDLGSDAVVVAHPAGYGVHGHAGDVGAGGGQRGGHSDIDPAREGCDGFLGAAGEDGGLLGVGQQMVGPDGGVAEAFAPVWVSMPAFSSSFRASAMRETVCSTSKPPMAPLARCTFAPPSWAACLTSS